MILFSKEFENDKNIKKEKENCDKKEKNGI